MERTDITANLVASSISPRGRRIDTFQARYPRIIHSEFMTHRVFSRNASSSRAIPTASLLVRDEDIFVPNFRHNQPGMQPGAFLSPEKQEEAADLWRAAAGFCANVARKLAAKDGLNIHKQHANRMLEWFGYIDVVITATDFENFFYLRDHEDAQDEIAVLARAMATAKADTIPEALSYGSWHLPYVSNAEQDQIWEAVQDNDAEMLALVAQLRVVVPRSAVSDDADLLMLVASAARCCRVSYSKQGTISENLAEDVLRFERLVRPDQPVHASPLEHQAKPSLSRVRVNQWGNLTGFDQFRKLVPGEAVFG